MKDVYERHSEHSRVSAASEGSGCDLISSGDETGIHVAGLTYTSRNANKVQRLEVDGDEKVKAGMIGAVVVVNEGISGGKGPCLLPGAWCQSVFMMCYGTECENNKSHLEAEAG